MLPALEKAEPHTPMAELIRLAIAQLREIDMEAGPPKLLSDEKEIEAVWPKVQDLYARDSGKIDHLYYRYREALDSFYSAKPHTACGNGPTDDLSAAAAAITQHFVENGFSKRDAVKAVNAVSTHLDRARHKAQWERAERERADSNHVNPQVENQQQPGGTVPASGSITVEAAATGVAEVQQPASDGWKAPIVQLRERLAEAIRTGNSKLLDGEEIGSLVGMAPDAAWESFRPELKQAKKAGLDVDITDLEKRRRMRQAAVEASNVRWNVAQVEKTGSAPALITSAVWEIAGIIRAASHFAVDPGRRLYVFKDGAYVPHGDAYVKRRVKAILIENKKPQAWQKKKAEEVLEFLTVDAPTLWERPSLDVVNVANGLVEVNSEKLMPHSPEYLSPVQIPVTFDPEAKCPAIDRFVVSTFPDDAVVIAYEIPAWLMTPDTSIQRAVLLTGDGANGKSTYLSLITAFVGRRNCSAVSLHKLEADRFSVARLVGRLANICPDLPGVDLQSTSIFKAITGGDEIQGEYKFRDAFEFTPYARLVFSANSLPRSSDASAAFFRRWLVLPFERRFVEGQNAIPRRELDAMLSDPTELSGLLNKALEKLSGLRERGFTESASTRQAAEEFRMTTDPLSIWLDHNTVARPDGIVTQDTLCSLYNADCIAKSRPAVTKQAFGRALAQARPMVEKKQRMMNRVLTWCYVGIGLLTGEEP